MEWFNKATDFRNAYSRYQAQTAQLRSGYIDPKKYPALAKERADMLARANIIDAKAKGVADGIASAYEYVRNAISSAGSAASGAWDWFKSSVGLNGLGFIPVLIGIAVIAPLVTLIISWSFDANKLQKKIDEQKRLESLGVPPAKASEMVGKAFTESTGPILTGVGNLAKYAIAGGALFVGLQVFMAMKKGK